jgi:hypothetical protein
MPYYSGIGSRQTPPSIRRLMVEIARKFADIGWTLRSGAAEGADTAFYLGAHDQRGPMDIYLPWRSFNEHTATYDTHRVIVPHTELANYPDAEALTRGLHPVYARLSQGAKKLHTRNVYQVLGDDLSTPSNLVVFWAQMDAGGTLPTGGTRTAVRLAQERGISTFNLLEPSVQQRFERWLAG